ncbi:MAG: RNA polymerase sigma factor [Cypionkella sp.]
MIPQITRPLRPDLHDTPEAALVALARQHDAEAARELIRRLNPRLYRVARGMMASNAEAEDVVQEAYLAAFTRLEQFRGQSAFATWVTRIAINAARMRLRRAPAPEPYDTVNEVEPAGAAVLPFPCPETAEMTLARHELRHMLEEVVADLPPDLRLVFLLRETEGLSVLEIAREISLNPITVKTRLFRARLRLRKALEGRLKGGFDSIFPFDGARCQRLTLSVLEQLRANGWR